MKITIVGLGYVGLSLSSLLSTHNEVTALDINEDKVNKVNNRICPVKDKEIEEYLKTKDLNLKATTDWKKALKDPDYIIICCPTNYDEETHFFDTSHVEEVIEEILSLNNTKSTIVIKSTIPVGYIDSIKKKYNIKNIFFSPEFLRDSRALYDNLYPSRIVIGAKTKQAKVFGELLKEACLKEDVPIIYMGTKEAEAIKLFANTYLALRVSFFNELDTFCERKKLNTKDVIKGVCLDPRIGDYYNNPSFGYGGYCLPKDTKQLLANYNDVPEHLVEAIVLANDIRIHHIVEMIMNKKPDVVGVYRLTMKTNSDNFRNSSVHKIISLLKENNINIMIYEPTVKENTYAGFEVVHDLKLFKDMSSIIIANRIDKEIEDCEDKIYSRDIFERD